MSASPGVSSQIPNQRVHCQGRASERQRIAESLQLAEIPGEKNYSPPFKSRLKLGYLFPLVPGDRTSLRARLQGSKGVDGMWLEDQVLRKAVSITGHNDPGEEILQQPTCFHIVFCLFFLFVCLFVVLFSRGQGN